MNVSIYFFKLAFKQVIKYFYGQTWLKLKALWGRGGEERLQVSGVLSTPVIFILLQGSATCSS